jgi:hypothetical protein
MKARGLLGLMRTRGANRCLPDPSRGLLVAALDEKTGGAPSRNGSFRIDGVGKDSGGRLRLQVGSAVRGGAGEERTFTRLVRFHRSAVLVRVLDDRGQNADPRGQAQRGKPFGDVPYVSHHVVPARWAHIRLLTVRRAVGVSQTPPAGDSTTTHAPFACKFASVILAMSRPGDEVKVLASGAGPVVEEAHPKLMIELGAAPRISPPFCSPACSPRLTSRRILPHEDIRLHSRRETVRRHPRHCPRRGHRDR